MSVLNGRSNITSESQPRGSSNSGEFADCTLSLSLDGHVNPLPGGLLTDTMPLNDCFQLRDHNSTQEADVENYAYVTTGGVPDEN